MTEWLSHAITAVCTASFVAAVGKVYVTGVLARHKTQMEQVLAQHKVKIEQDAADAVQRREDRQNEITVLHQSIDELRGDRDALKREMGEQRAYFESRANRRDKEINDLKSEHTACLVAMAEAKQSERWLAEQNARLTERVRTLEAEVAQLRGTERG